MRTAGLILLALIPIAASAASVDWQARLLRARDSFEETPSPSTLCALLDTLELAGSPSGDDSLRTLQLRSWLRRMPRESWDPPHTLRLLEHVQALEQTALLAGSLRVHLLESHPSSQACWEAVHEFFLGSLYPVWSDDTAKVEVMEEFVADLGPHSEYWRSRAWAVIVSSTESSGDTASARGLAREWVESCPGSPSARLAAGLALLEQDSAPAALDELEAGLLIVRGGWRPPGMPIPETALTLPRLEHDLELARARALFALGDTTAGLRALEPLLDPGLYPDSVHHTPYRYLLEAAEARLSLRDTTEAISLLVQAEELGRTRADPRGAEGALTLLDTLLQAEDAVAACRALTGYRGPVFEDVSAAMFPDSGLPCGTRAAWRDFDRDGWPDLLLGRRLFRNRNGAGFEEVTESSGLRLPMASGGIWGDLNGDGWPDLVTCGRQSWVVLNRAGRFTSGLAEWQPREKAGPVEGVGLLDWNGDGRLDVYLARYEKPDQLGSGSSDLFLLGDREGLRPCGDSLGFDLPGSPLCGRGVSPADFDRDGDMDLLVSNYRLDANLLWENRGQASEVALDLGVELPARRGYHGHTIGSAWADYDNDGDWDLFCANLAHPRYIRFSQRSRLLRNDDGVFSDATAGSGIRYEETHSVPVWGDFDGDGLQDLYITSVYEGRRSFLYLNLGEGRFREVGFLSGARVLDGWGAAAADFDRDGRLDLAVGAGDGPHLFRNATPDPGNWLLFHVRPDSVPAVGCVLEVRQDDVVMLRQVEGGGGTSCQNGETLHLALPENAPAEWRLFLPGSDRPVATGVVSPRRELTVP